MIMMMSGKIVMGFSKCCRQSFLARKNERMLNLLIEVGQSDIFDTTNALVFFRSHLFRPMVSQHLNDGHDGVSTNDRIIHKNNPLPSENTMMHKR